MDAKMVFDLKNTRIHKKILLMIVFSLLALSIFSVQLDPVGAQTPEASLTSLISDRGVDTDADGLFNFLEIGVEVNVSSAGTFQVEVLGLSDSSFNYINVTNQSSMDLDIGIQVVYISLDGETIYGLGLNPAYVSGVVVLDESDNELDTLYDFSLSKEYLFSEFQHPPIIIDIQFDEIKREVILDYGRSIHITTTYSITNNGDDISTVEFGFPEDANDVVLRDEMGNLEVSLGSETMTVNLRETLYTNETTMLYLSYHVPWEKYINQKHGLDYNLHFTFYEHFDWTIGELTVSVVLPEGASFQSSTPINPSNVERSGLQDIVTFTFSDVTPSDNLNFNLNYRYLMFWSSFFPTIWVGVLVAVVTVLVFLWKVPTPVSTPLITVPPEDLRMFVNAYEEKERIQSELKSMEKRLQKHKIPRRRYKVRKKMLDGRLATISKDLAFHREKIRAAGYKYANMMRQIEVAETNLEGAERDIRRAKARYRRGEVSKDAYGKLMDEYTRRSEEAEATIDGVILRLRDEIP